MGNPKLHAASVKSFSAQFLTCEARAHTALYCLNDMVNLLTTPILAKRYEVAILSWLTSPVLLISSLAFPASAFVLHNIFLDLQEDQPMLPPNILEPEFQQRLQRGQINIRPMGRPIDGNFLMRNLVIGQFFWNLLSPAFESQEV